MEEIKPQIAVIGAGLMGAGIASRVLAAGMPVIVLDTSLQRLAQAHAGIRDVLEELREGGRLNAPAVEAALQRVRFERHLDEIADCAVIFEAINEQLDAKRELYARLEQVISPFAAIASNTSGFLPDDLSAVMDRPERFVVAHFWNPPHVIPLVEVVPSSRTAPRLVERVVDLLLRLQMEPVVLKTAIPGFVGNRLQFALLREALNIVQSGAADAATVDQVTKACLGRRYKTLGPFECADLGGLGTILDVAGHLLPELAHDEAVLEVLKQKVAQGEIGALTGRGFYDWTEERRCAVRQRRIQELSQSGR